MFKQRNEQKGTEGIKWAQTTKQANKQTKTHTSLRIQPPHAWSKQETSVPRRVPTVTVPSLAALTTIRLAIHWFGLMIVEQYSPRRFAARQISTTIHLPLLNVVQFFLSPSSPPSTRFFLPLPAPIAPGFSPPWPPPKINNAPVEFLRCHAWVNNLTAGLI